MTDDLLDLWTRLMKDYTDAPKQYILAGGYYLLSTTLGHGIVDPQAPGEVEVPNLWVFIAGAPAITRKSTVYGQVTSTMRQALQEVEESNGIEYSYPDAVMLESGTKEGIADHIDENTELGNNLYTFAGAEYGAEMVSIQKKGYMRGVRGLLSKLYTGEPERFALSQRGENEDGGARMIPPNLYVTFMGLMQKPWDYLEPNLLTQGLMRRFLLVYAKPEDKRDIIPIRKASRRKAKEKLNKYAKKLGQRMSSTWDEKARWMENSFDYGAERGFIELRFESGVDEKIHQFQKSLEEDIQQEETDWNLYRQSFWEHLNKLSIIRALARRKPKEQRLGYTLKVKEEDLETAYKDFRLLTKRCKETVSKIASGSHEYSPRMDKRGLEFVEKKVEMGEDYGLTRGRLLQETNMLKGELRKHVISLMESDRVACSVDDDGKIYFNTKEYEEEVQNGQGRELKNSRWLESYW